MRARRLKPRQKFNAGTPGTCSRFFLKKISTLPKLSKIHFLHYFFIHTPSHSLFHSLLSLFSSTFSILYYSFSTIRSPSPLFTFYCNLFTHPYINPRFFNSQKHLTVAEISASASCASSKSSSKSLVWSSDSLGHLYPYGPDILQ